MLKTILISAVVLIAGILLYAATMPDAFRIQRTVSINAPADKIFPFINDFHNWSAWSPWEKLDLAMKKTHSGAPHGQGAAYEWDGNSDVGTGRSEIVETVPPSRVLIRLDFLKPFEAHNYAEFTLAPHTDSTQVTWAMYGPQPYVAKVIHIFVSMDRMVGKNFETGLANLKAAAEK